MDSGVDSAQASDVEEIQPIASEYDLDFSKIEDFDLASSISINSIKFRENLMNETIEKQRKYINPLKVVNSFLKLLESPNFDFLLRKKLLYSFSPLHSSTLISAFNDYIPKQQNFNQFWIVFASLARLFVSHSNIDLSLQIMALDQAITKAPEEIQEIYQTLKSVLSNSPTNSEQAKILLKAVQNFEGLLNNGEFDPSILKCVKELKKRVEQICLSFELLELINSYDQSLIEVKNIHKSQFTYQENCKLLRSTLSYALLTINSTHMIISDKAANAISLIHRISHLSNYVQINEIADLLKQYKQALVELTTTDIRSDETQFQILDNFISQQKPSVNTYIKEYYAFKEARNKYINDNKNPGHVHHLFEKFLSLILKENLDPIIESVLDSIHNLWGQLALEQKIIDDATSLINFATTYPNKKINMIEAVQDVIDSISEMIDEDLFNYGVIDFFSRIRLMFLVFKALYNTSASHLSNTADDFFHYFPDIFAVKDILKPPKKVEKDPILAKIAGLGTINFKPETLKEIFNEISYSISSPLSSKLDTVARFISKTRQFYTSFIPDGGVSPDKYDFIISPTNDTPIFVRLIESILPLLAFNPTSSLALAEKAFALVLAAIYHPYADRNVAKNTYNGVLKNLSFRVPDLSFRFAAAICSSLRKLSTQGKVTLTIEEIDTFESAYFDVVTLDSKASPSKLNKALNIVIEKAPTPSMYDGLTTFSKTLLLFDEVSKSMIEVAKMLEIDDKISPNLVPLTVVGTMTQTMALMFHQLTGDPLFQDMKVWPFTSNQTNLIIFSEVDDGKCFQRYADYLQENKSNVPTIPPKVLLDASRSMAQVCSVYSKSYVVDPNLTQQVSVMMSDIQKKAIEAEQTGDIASFITDAFVEQFTLLSILNKRHVNFAVITAMTDIKNFRSMLLEYYAFSTLPEKFGTMWKALQHLPEIFRPKSVDEKIEFSTKQNTSDEDKDDLPSFKENLNKLKQKLEESEKIEAIKDDFDFLEKSLSQISTRADPAEIKYHHARIQARLNASKTRIETQIAAVNNEIQRIQSGQQSLTKREILSVHQNADEVEKKIGELEEELEKAQTDLSNETGAVSELAEECRSMKGELARAHAQKNDIQQSLLDENKSTKSDFGTKNQSILEYTRLISAQNLKLRTAIKRARLAKKVPALQATLSTETQDTSDLEKTLDNLKKEVSEIEQSLSKVDDNFIQEQSGVKKVFVPPEVSEFMQMTEKLRTGKIDEVQPLMFLTVLDFVEKYAFELSQSRRDMFAYLTGGEKSPSGESPSVQSDMEYDFEGEPEEEENPQTNQ